MVSPPPAVMLLVLQLLVEDGWCKRGLLIAILDPRRCDGGIADIRAPLLALRSRNDAVYAGRAAAWRSARPFALAPPLT